MVANTTLNSIHNVWCEARCTGAMARHASILRALTHRCVWQRRVALKARLRAGRMIGSEHPLGAKEFSIFSVLKVHPIDARKRKEGMLRSAKDLEICTWAGEGSLLKATIRARRL